MNFFMRNHSIRDLGRMDRMLSCVKDYSGFVWYWKKSCWIKICVLDHAKWADLFVFRPSIWSFACFPRRSILCLDLLVLSFACLSILLADFLCTVSLLMFSSASSLAEGRVKIRKVHSRRQSDVYWSRGWVVSSLTYRFRKMKSKHHHTGAFEYK